MLSYKLKFTSMNTYNCIVSELQCFVTQPLANTANIEGNKIACDVYTLTIKNHAKCLKVGFSQIQSHLKHSTRHFACITSFFIKVVTSVAKMTQ